MRARNNAFPGISRTHSSKTHHDAVQNYDIDAHFETILSYPSPANGSDQQTTNNTAVHCQYP